MSQPPAHRARYATSGVGRGATSTRRVRHGVRDGLAVMAFSAASSIAMALLFLVAARILISAGN